MRNIIYIIYLYIIYYICIYIIFLSLTQYCAVFERTAELFENSNKYCTVKRVISLRYFLPHTLHTLCILPQPETQWASLSFNSPRLLHQLGPGLFS